MPGRDTAGKKFSVAVLSFLAPPAAVALETGEGCETWVNFGLTLLGWFPGIIHALIVGFSDVRIGCVQMGNVDMPGMPLSSSTAAYGGTTGTAYSGGQTGTGYGGGPTVGYGGTTGYGTTATQRPGYSAVSTSDKTL